MSYTGIRTVLTKNENSTVPPVVDPVHYGIHSAEPLWPIRGPKLPQFHLAPEAMLASSSTDQRWRSRQALRPKKTDVIISSSTTPRTTQFRPSQQTRRPSVDHQRLTQFHRHPVRSTAWKRYDHGPSNQLIGRSPALGPPLPVVLPTFRPGVMPTVKPDILPMSRPRIVTPTFRPGHPLNDQQQRRQSIIAAGRQNASPDFSSSSNRYFSSNARSYESVIGGSSREDNSNAITSSNNRNSHLHNSLNVALNEGAESIDRVDDDLDGLLLNDTSSESLLNEKKKDVQTSDEPPADHHQRKRAKKPFFPFQFVIQSGYSKVRKYGNEIQEFIR